MKFIISLLTFMIMQFSNQLEAAGRSMSFNFLLDSVDDAPGNECHHQKMMPGTKIETYVTQLKYTSDQGLKAPESHVGLRAAACHEGRHQRQPLHAALGRGCRLEYTNV